jgi:hypothetical protein
MATLSTNLATQEGVESASIEGSNVTTNASTSTTTTSTENTTTVSSVGIQGESGAASPLSQNQEVDAVSEGLLNGSVLVYKTATLKWTATRHLDQQDMDAGEF